MSCSCSRATCCPSDEPSYPVRNLAFEAAQQAFDCDNVPDEEDFVDLDTPDCENPANEPLCEAIMEKARSYSVDEVYSARAYRRAAEKVASLTVSVFTLTEKQRRVLGVGPKTNWFIYNWIVEANPESVVSILLEMNETARCVRTVMLSAIRSLLLALPDGYGKLRDALASIHDRMDAEVKYEKVFPPRGRLDELLQVRLATMDPYVAAIVLMDDLNAFYYARNQGSVTQTVVKRLNGYKAQLVRLNAECL